MCHPGVAGEIGQIRLDRRRDVVVVHAGHADRRARGANEPPGIRRASLGTGSVGLLFVGHEPLCRKSRVESEDVHTRSNRPRPKSHPTVHGPAVRPRRDAERRVRRRPPRARAGQRAEQHRTRPASPERAELKARLKSMAAEQIDIPLIIGGKEIRTGQASAQSVMPHDHRHVLADYHLAGAGARPAGDRRRGRGAPRVGELAVGRSRRGVPARRRAARHDLARDAQRRDDARASRRRRSRRRSTRRREMIDFWRFNACFAQELYSEQPISSPGVWNQLEYRAARRLRLRGHAVQLHRDRRQPDDRAGADGQHRHLEAGVDARC